MQSDPFFLIFVYFQLSMAVTLWMKKRGLLLTLALAGYVGILLLMVVYSTFRSGMYFIRMLNEIGPRIYKDTFLFFNFLSQFASIFRYIVLFFYTIRLSLRDGDMRAEKSRRRWIVPGLLTAFNNFLGMIGLIYHELYTVGGRVFSLVNISGILNSTAFLIAIFFLCYYVAYPHRMK